MSETTQTRQKVAEKAAHWWAAALQAPKFDNLGRGERDPASEMAGMLATMTHRAPAVSTLAAFEAALRDKLATMSGRVCLDCDYGPDMTLADIAAQVGLTSSFPWKTTMWLDFEKGTVKVKYGYGAETQEL